MIQRNLCSVSCAIALIAAFASAFSLATCAQSDRRDSQHDLLAQLLPDGAVPKDLKVMPNNRELVIKELKKAQARAYGKRGQQIAFVLAALNVDYIKNRDYLFHALSGCNHPEIRYGCDDMTGEYLIYLYRHGHSEILAPLMKTSIGSYDAAGSEGLGADFGEMIRESPGSFLQAVSTLPLV